MHKKGKGWDVAIHMASLWLVLSIVIIIIMDEILPLEKTINTNKF